MGVMINTLVLCSAHIKWFDPKSNTKHISNKHLKQYSEVAGVSIKDYRHTSWKLTFNTPENYRFPQETPSENIRGCDRSSNLKTCSPDPQSWQNLILWDFLWFTKTFQLQNVLQLWTHIITVYTKHIHRPNLSIFEPGQIAVYLQNLWNWLSWFNDKWSLCLDSDPICNTWETPVSNLYFYTSFVGVRPPVQLYFSRKLTAFKAVYIKCCSLDVHHQINI